MNSAPRRARSLSNLAIALAVLAQGGLMRWSHAYLAVRIMAPGSVIGALAVRFAKAPFRAIRALGDVPAGAECIDFEVIPMRVLPIPRGKTAQIPE